MSDEVIKVPEFAPGCFGSALAYSTTDMICRACPFESRCEPVHQHAKAILKARFGVTAQREPKVKAAKPVEGPVLVNTCQRTEALLKWIEGMKIGVVDKLRAGVNPFGAKTKHLAVICHLLLNKPVTTEPMMITALETVLKCQRKNAEDYMRICLRVLDHLGAIAKTQTGYTVRSAQ